MQILMGEVPLWWRPPIRPSYRQNDDGHIHQEVRLIPDHWGALWLHWYMVAGMTRRPFGFDLFLSKRSTAREQDSVGRVNGKSSMGKKHKAYQVHDSPTRMHQRFNYWPRTLTFLNHGAQFLSYKSTIKDQLTSYGTFTSTCQNFETSF